MDIRNCRRCGRVYSYDGFNICPKCRRDDEADFQKVKKYIEENPSANIKEISDETEVDSKKIIEFLKEGRLEVRDENNLLLSCERCGKPIKTGRFCDKCTLEMQREFKQAIGNRQSDTLQNTKIKQKIRVTERYRDDEKK